MTSDDVDLAETRLVRARVLDHLRREGWRAVMEGLVAHDGWRGEFLGQDEGRDVVLMAHKPFGAPYVGLATSIDLEGFERGTDLEELLDLTSDHDLSPYFAAPDRDLLHLSTRLPVAAVTERDLDYAIGNLRACRARLASRFSGGAP